MTDRERKELMDGMKHFMATMTPESAREFLIGAGIYTKEGVLAEPYEDLYIPQPDEVSAAYAR